MGIILGQIAMSGNDDYNVNLISGLPFASVKFGGFTGATGVARQPQNDYQFFKYTANQPSLGANYNRENFIKDTFAYADTGRPTLNRPERRVEDTGLYIVS